MNSKIRNKINETRKKIEVNKAEKENRLINEGFNLFITQGINNTSVQDIVVLRFKILLIKLMWQKELSIYTSKISMN